MKGAANVDTAQVLFDSLALAGEREKRALRLGQPHMRQLTAYVHELTKRTGLVPYFDPMDGGCRAKILLLLQSPSAYAVHPRFVSQDNPVATQRNLRSFLAEAGVKREMLVMWNIFPWLPESRGARKRGLNKIDFQEGLAELPGLLVLLKDLRVVVLAGRGAQNAHTFLASCLPGLTILDMPHPSPLAVCANRGVAPKIVSVLKYAHDLALDAELTDRVGP
ncbi:uracil-DNA glycosylase [Robbsia sp. Bb-Pol-6]|uniref:Uracil-DNA glycosylase n=1 Tax=Robbsia betulipollinis TaxID=2981849 RepID=A0ABT3ZRB2_9BURK|nr:uracil-DNA glycosylase [Robbsia betulipollinis]MCY0388428.1 uracil-DNA glycosylase [Robbsia betulipollinis]